MNITTKASVLMLSELAMLAGESPIYDSTPISEILSLPKRKAVGSNQKKVDDEIKAHVDLLPKKLRKKFWKLVKKQNERPDVAFIIVTEGYEK